jgi:hypothetical protein
MTTGEYLRKKFDKLPPECQDRVFVHLYKALLHRGGGFLMGPPTGGMYDAVKEIGNAFADGGQEVEEYA